MDLGLKAALTESLRVDMGRLSGGRIPIGASTRCGVSNSGTRVASCVEECCPEEEELLLLGRERRFGEASPTSPPAPNASCSKSMELYMGNALGAGD